MGNKNSIEQHSKNARKTGVFSLSKKGIKELPAELFADGLLLLRTLDLSHNRLEQLPATLQVFASLKYLDCQHNRLVSVPDALSSLSRLVTLNLSHNSITQLPDSLNRLAALKVVDLSFNCLPEMPQCVLTLPQLDSLDLSHNVIAKLPSQAESLSCSELNLNHNKLEALPESIARCANLRTLRVEHNLLPLSGVPDCLLASSAVSLLLLEGNRFQMKQLLDRPGYELYMGRYTDTKKKLT